MSTSLERARKLKTQAKNRRDAHRYPAARSRLRQALELLEEDLGAATDVGNRSELASELADCWGLLGGIERRWALDGEANGSEDFYREHMSASAKAYDAGYDDYESSPEFGIIDSYNLVNRLVSRILLEPACLADEAMEVEGLKVMEQLAIARDEVRDQTRRARRGDIWALADLALLDILVERRSPLSAYIDFISQSPPDYAYDSALSALKPLQPLDLPMKNEIEEAISHLQSRLDRLSQ